MKQKAKISLFGPSAGAALRPSLSPFAAVSPEQQVAQAATLARQGRRMEAETLLKDVLRRQPPHAGALQMLGLLALTRGDHAEGVRCLRQSLETGPAQASVYNNLGIGLRELGRHDEALEAFEKALALQPDHAGALTNAGNLLRLMGRHPQALERYGQALAHSPTDARIWHAQGLCQQALGDWPAAVKSLGRASELDPGHAAYFCALGTALEMSGDFEAARQAFAAALALDDAQVDALNGMGLVLVSLRRPFEAAAFFERAVAAHPQAPEAWANLASLRHDEGRHAEALALYQKALEAGADRVGVLQHLGELHADLRQYSAAAQAYRDLLQARPDFDFAQAAFFANSMKAFDWVAADEVRAPLEAALRQGTAKALPFDVLSFFDDPALHLTVAQRHVSGLYRSPVAFQHSPRAPGRRWRVAYVSADFHEHATMHLMREVFEHHDRERFEWVAVSIGAVLEPQHKAWLDQTFDEVIDGRTMSDPALIEHLRCAALDLAVDLKGHTQEARFELFESRIAPVQVSYLGYPGTTGSRQMDYVLGDAVVTPMEDQPHYTERIYQLPGCYQPNTALASEPVPPAPSREQEGLPPQGLVLASFNNPYKLQPPVLDVWAEVLRAVPDSVLWLLAAEPSAQERLRQFMVDRGVAQARVVFAPRRNRSEHLARHRLADLFLDNLPYGAHTTASDILRTGVVLVTCTGRAFASRVAASLLRVVGCDDLITYSMADYRQRLLSLATQPQALAQARERVQAGVRNSALFDPVAMARHLEAAYEQMLMAAAER